MVNGGQEIQREVNGKILIVYQSDGVGSREMELEMLLLGLYQNPRYPSRYL